LLKDAGMGSAALGRISIFAAVSAELSWLECQKATRQLLGIAKYSRARSAVEKYLQIGAVLS
jgi:hypothetical protein